MGISTNYAVKVLAVTHEESRTGAPRVLLDILGRLREWRPASEVTLVALESGVLRHAFQDLVERRVEWPLDGDIYRFMMSNQPDVVLINSCCCHAWAVEASRAGLRTVYIIHEPPEYVQAVIRRGAWCIVPVGTT